MPCCQFPLSCHLASFSWLGIFFFFLTCALYHKAQFQCPQQLQGDAGLRQDREQGMWYRPVFPQAAGAPVHFLLPFSASLQPKPARIARTRVWEPLASWDLKPLAHVITQTRLCWQPQALPASLSAALGHDLLVLWLGLRSRECNYAKINWNSKTFKSLDGIVYPSWSIPKCKCIQTMSCLLKNLLWNPGHLEHLYRLQRETSTVWKVPCYLLHPQKRLGNFGKSPEVIWNLDSVQCSLPALEGWRV